MQVLLVIGESKITIDRLDDVTDLAPINVHMAFAHLFTPRMELLLAW
jgi:hypothetical protein